MTPQILYEDNHVIVAVKPRNMLSQADSSGDESILGILKEYIRVKYEKPGAAYLGLVHRLDRPAGGLMVFARTSKAAARLSAQVQDGRFEKTYYAVVTGDPEPHAVLEDWLIKDHKTNTSRRAHMGDDGAKLARLEYEAVACSAPYTLLRVQLFTGRAHQIRVQLMLRGCPLAGDRRYGGIDAQMLCLWATHLCFEHPTKKERMCFSSPWPASGPWACFPFAELVER